MKRWRRSSRSPTNSSPQVFDTVVRCRDKFDMVEEDVASAEVKALRADLAAMICIEVS